MTADDYGEALYLIILGGAVVIWFVASNRLSLGKVAQQALAWVLIFVAVIAAVGVWDDIRGTITPRQSVVSETGQITVPRSVDGHYYLTLEVNGEPVNFLVDTGASQVVLNLADAERIGFDDGDLIFSSQASTANGIVGTAPIRLDRVVLGPYEDRRVRAWVNEGDLEQSLLGMSYLQLWSSVQFSNGALVLTR
ncbi:MAG: TIGR02281 family clan AA aspartic protease [Rhodobacteraceae bacterium]|nr:TIGR02281 family clan AA aspartic protease [Paracoccaceae bacterium]